MINQITALDVVDISKEPSKSSLPRAGVVICDVGSQHERHARFEMDAPIPVPGRGGIRLCVEANQL
jgi:hypothetical protein